MREPGKVAAEVKQLLNDKKESDLSASAETPKQGAALLWTGNQKREIEKEIDEKKPDLKLLQKELIAACKLNDVEKVDALIKQGADTNAFDFDATSGSPDHHPLRAALYSLSHELVDLSLSRADENTMKLKTEIGESPQMAHILQLFCERPTFGEFYNRYNAKNGGDLYNPDGTCKVRGVPECCWVDYYGVGGAYGQAARKVRDGCADLVFNSQTLVKGAGSNGQTIMNQLMDKLKAMPSLGVEQQRGRVYG